jgi:hypothetical protein
MNPKFRSPVKGANDSVLQRGFKQVLIPHIKKETKCFSISATPWWQNDHAFCLVLSMLEFPNQCLKPMEMKQRIPFYPLLNGRSFSMMIWSKAPLFPIHRFKQPLANCSTVHIESQLDRLSPLHTTHLQFPYCQHFTFQADQDAQVWSTRYIEFWIRFWFATSPLDLQLQANCEWCNLIFFRVFTRSAGQHVNSCC